MREAMARRRVGSGIRMEGSRSPDAGEVPILLRTWCKPIGRGSDASFMPRFGCRRTTFAGKGSCANGSSR
jgi:hypothetical protein